MKHGKIAPFLMIAVGVCQLIISGLTENMYFAIPLAVLYVITGIVLLYENGFNNKR